MATRLYWADDIDYNGPVVTPFGTWNSDFHLLHHLAPTGNPSLTEHSFISRGVNTSSSAGTIVHALGVTPPLADVYSWGANTVTWIAKVEEEFSTQNAFQMFYWGILANDGTLIDISSLEKGATEFPTSLASRIRTDADGNVDISNAIGDRFFCEVGWDKDAAVSGLISIQYAYSDTSGDLSGDGDTGVQNGYVELSNDVTFDPEGTVYGTVPSRLMMGLL